MMTSYRKSGEDNLHYTHLLLYNDHDDEITNTTSKVIATSPTYISLSNTCYTEQPV